VPKFFDCLPTTIWFDHNEKIRQGNICGEMCFVPYVHPHDVTESNQILHGDLKERDNFYRVQHTLQHAPNHREMPQRHIFETCAHMV